MLSLVVLGFALAFALISRVLLFIDALSISRGWAFGVLLPFGPLFFRLNYPDEARRSMLFRYLTLICAGLFFVMGPGPAIRKLKRQKVEDSANQRLRPGDNVYGIEKATLAQRRAANDLELQRMQQWSEELRLRKRDLLRSDVQGNRAYAIEHSLYDESLAKVMAERDALDNASKDRTKPNKPGKPAGN